MQLDFEVQRCTRRCAATDRPLEPGETCYSVLEVQGANVIRKDYCQSAWSGPPVEALGWWMMRIPEQSAKKVKLAPNDVLLELFDQLAEQPFQEDMRYVLALLLVRRRVLRVEAPLELASATTDPGSRAMSEETLVVYSPKRETTYEVNATMPSNERIEEIQRQLSELLTSGTE